MTMTKEEIVAEYKQSKNKRNQIQILADLNTCSKDDILTILKESGQVKQQELPRYSNVKAEKTIAPGETKEGELNDLEKSMSEIITELRGENDNLKGTIQELNDKIGGYETREQNLTIELAAAQDRVKQLEDELADTKSALESTESQLDSEITNARAAAEHGAEMESRLRSTIMKLEDNERALNEQIETKDRAIERKDKIMESMTQAISVLSDQFTNDQKERNRISEVMMKLIEKFVLS